MIENKIELHSKNPIKPDYLIGLFLKEAKIDSGTDVIISYSPPHEGCKEFVLSYTVHRLVTSMIPFENEEPSFYGGGRVRIMKVEVPSARIAEEAKVHTLTDMSFTDFWISVAEMGKHSITSNVISQVQNALMGR